MLSTAMRALNGRWGFRQIIRLPSSVDLSIAHPALTPAANRREKGHGDAPQHLQVRALLTGRQNKKTAFRGLE